VEFVALRMTIVALLTGIEVETEEEDDEEVFPVGVCIDVLVEVELTLLDAFVNVG